MPKPWKSVKNAKLVTDARVRVRSRVVLEELTLRELRRERALTQIEVSRNASMSQPDLSRLEQRGDHLTSTLRRYVEALGGELEVTAVFGARRVKITDA